MLNEERGGGKIGETVTEKGLHRAPRNVTINHNYPLTYSKHSQNPPALIRGVEPYPRLAFPFFPNNLPLFLDSAP